MAGYIATTSVLGKPWNTHLGRMMSAQERRRRARSQSRQDEIDENRRQFDEALAANESRYQQALAVNNQTAANVGGLLEGQGQAARADINEAANAQLGSLAANATMRGLGNSSVIQSQRAGVLRQRARSLQGVQESVGRLRASAAMSLGSERAGIIQDRQDPAPALMYDDGLDALDDSEFGGADGGFRDLTGDLGRGRSIEDYGYRSTRETRRRARSSGSSSGSSRSRGETGSQRRNRLNRERRERETNINRQRDAGRDSGSYRDRRYNRGTTVRAMPTPDRVAYQTARRTTRRLRGGAII